MRACSIGFAAAFTFGAAAFALAAAARAQSSSDAPRMKAIVYRDFGSPDVLRLEEIAVPVPRDDEILVRVRAAAVNPFDWHFIEGTPYVARIIPGGFGLLHPSEIRAGNDFAGTVEAVGKDVTRFKAGDDVFGARTGAFAERLCVRADRGVALKPASVSFEQAAAIPIAALTALQGLRDRGRVKPGERVLINGASGGVGTYAVQLAKHFGADVTAVCSARNAELVRSLGARRVIDYTQQDFTELGERWDVILDNVGNRSLLALRRALEPDGRCVLIGGGGVDDGRWFGPLVRPFQALALSPFIRQEMGLFMADLSHADLAFLAELMQAGKLTSIIDRRYKLSEAAEAVRYLEEGHARGKVVVTVDGDDPTPVAAAARAGTSSATALIALALIALAVGVTIAPIVAAFVWNARFRRRHPDARSFRWGYYFSLLSFLAGLGLVVLLEGGLGAWLCGLAYALLAWSFARRRRWAWIALTLLSLNPLVWLINFVYLRKRWAEGPAPAG